MMENIFLSILSISLSTSVVVLALIVLGSLINKRYVAKWKYGIWIVLALRLLVPIHYELLDAQFQITIPAEVGSLAVSDVFVTESPGLKVQPVPVPMTEPAVTEPQIKASLPVQPDVQKTAQPSITLLQALGYLWAAGAICLLVWQLTVFICYKRRLIKRGRAAENPVLLEQLRELSRELGIRKQVSLLVYANASSPMIIGFWKPLLVLPGEEYTQEESFYILKHELIHLRRHDVFVKFLLLMARDFHWFNPVVYLMHREAVVDMELACDEAVVRGGSFDQRQAYTETLMSTLHRQQGGGFLLSTQFSGSKRIMKKRFQNILSKAKKRNGVILFVVILLLTVTVGTMVGYAMEEPAPEMNEEEEPAALYVEGNSAGDLSDGTGEDTPQINSLMYGNVGNLGLGTLVYTVPDADDEDYRLYFFKSEDEEDRYQLLSEMSFDLSKASYIFPDVREGNVSIGKFKEMYYVDTTDISEDNIAEVIVAAIYEVDGEEHYDIRIYESGEDGYNVNVDLTQQLNQKYYYYGEGSYPVYNEMSLPDDSWTKDAQELGNIMTLFYTAYFNKDTETVRQYLAQSFGGKIWFSDEIDSLEEVEIFGIKGLDSSMQANVGDECELSLEFRLPNEDSLTYLTVGFVKEDIGWKVGYYGMEK